MFIYHTVIAAIAALLMSNVLFANEIPASGMKPVAVLNAAQAVKVNINTATVTDLMKISGLTAAKAKAIISYRNKNGNFKSLADLTKVRGFGRMKEEKLKSIQNQMTLG